MSAQVDRDQPIRFHFGNAAIDLAHLLPEEDPSVVQMEMQKLLQRCDKIFDEIEKKRFELSYLISDIKRQIG